MTKDLLIHFEIRQAPPIAVVPDAALLRATLQSRGFSRLTLVGVDALGMTAERVQLAIEPDVEFLIVFARAIEAASRQNGTAPPVFLDDGILELSASFQSTAAWSRMGYLSDARKVELDGSKLLALWRVFHESILRAAER